MDVHEKRILLVLIRVPSRRRSGGLGSLRAHANWSKRLVPASARVGRSQSRIDFVIDPQS
jgi:hypothetical protein